jgi:DNA primase
VSGFDMVMIPHFGVAGEVCGVKRRSPQAGWVPTAVKGSKLETLYGAWRDKGHQTLIVCEGESDTWTLAHRYRDHPVDVAGLPSGVAAKPRDEWLWRCQQHQQTILVFDGDEAGRLGAARWKAALPGAYVARLREGADVTSATRVEVSDALLASRS